MFKNTQKETIFLASRINLHGISNLWSRDGSCFIVNASYFYSHYVEPVVQKKKITEIFRHIYTHFTAASAAASSSSSPSKVINYVAHVSVNRKTYVDADYSVNLILLLTLLRIQKKKKSLHFSEFLNSFSIHEWVTEIIFFFFFIA